MSKHTTPNDAYRMDGHKLYWHLDRVLAWQRGEPIAPLHIDFGITTGCNFACRYCYGMLQGRKGKKNAFHMPQDAILRFFTDAKAVGVRSIALIGEGENTLNPALYPAIAHAGRIDLDLSLATNGLELPLAGLDEALSVLRWIRFNISAASPEGYAAIHGVGPADHARVLANIRACVERKRALGLGVAIGLQAVLLQGNLQEVVPLARLGRELGVDYLVVKPCSDTYDSALGAPLDAYEQLETDFVEAEGFSGEGYNVIVKRQKIGNKGVKAYRTCYGTEFLLAISGNGNVYPCGHWFKYADDKYLMGNIIEQRFSDIVASQRYADAQRAIKNVNVNRDCESNCRQHYINNFLQMLADKPDHINFI
ncbi:radical SAM/SPASM domain-containing protein [Solidesulfovibrio carbinolicus]|uniref:Radical SAM protein n=1 Tax=Solidesulfovibrio carbinolicus TaxID=296842 RepID=A0A4P6HR62_9BACT|nr:radical SAM/SPASM domain-containing protein [Solidesulfovibrio carbinolicus]QAZ69645.1 radical SAM protein [Solidesulfovibrio carbinolicus]